MEYIRDHLIDKEYRDFIKVNKNSKFKVKTCKEGLPICFKENEKLIKRDGNIILKTKNILKNLQHDFFNPYIVKKDK